MAQIDPRDVGTPDEWVSRHPELIQLTGRHPFNSEPPLKYTSSFITPMALHYVRNHGPVPKLQWNTHTFSIDGLVNKPRTFGMNELVTIFAAETVTFPVLLVCAGNRRKEQNEIKKTIGFSWGAAGCSTAEWTGVPLHVLLTACGVDREKAQWVWFEGTEDLPHDKYGTCIRASTALDPSCDVLVAWKANGELLTPDHGFPVRLIIPGHIGGRMVKWLARIHVSDHESTNHHHIMDNRVLPSHVTAETATAEGWWSKSPYAIMELNVNAAMIEPDHNEVLAISKDDTVNDIETYVIKGYAYSGGGRRVIRVELTLDDGATWQLAHIIYDEKPNPYGKMWCWVHYELAVPVSSLLRAKEVCVRAWDSSMNLMPEFPTWNVMGMMNNPWYRVKIHHEETANTLRFEHPTQAGNQKGGWMTKDRIITSDKNPIRSKKLHLEAAGDAVDTAAVRPGLSPEELNSLSLISTDEVAEHNTKESCWFICRGLVYDATPFLEEHPGGATSILLCGGTDCTDEFESIHSTKAWQMLKKYCIGRCSSTGDDTAASDTASSTANSDETDVALKGATKVPLVLISREVISHDTRIFKFALPAKDLRLGLPVGNHVFLYAKINGKTVVRAYTPISSESDEDRGFVSFLIKIYFAGENPVHPEGGLFSQYLDGLHLGQQIQIKGPLGHFTYHGEGNFSLESTNFHAGKFGFIAGGTGITPVYQIMRAILENPGDKTKVALIYCVRLEQDLLLRKELEALQKLRPGQCRIFYTLSDLQESDKNTRRWAYGKSRLNFAMVQNIIGSDADHVGMCGPEPMIEFACKPALTKLNYDIKTQTTVFYDIARKEVVVVVGNGMVGHRFLERMRKYDTTKRYTFVSVGEEPIQHYNRMLLTEYFEHLSMEKLKLAPPNWYVENDVELLMNAQALAVDTANKKLLCQRLDHDVNKGEQQFEVAYDHVVIATGATALVPRLPGIDLPGVFVYRTIADLNNIIKYGERQAKSEAAGAAKKYALVVGGGLLGLEAAKAVHDLHVSVRIINRGTRLMSRQLDEDGAKVLYNEIVNKFGIDVLYEKSTQGILGTKENGVEGVEFTNGETFDDVCMVIFATGIKPRDELAHSSGLELAKRGGILINDYLECSTSNVYALGECISHRNATYGLVAPGYEMADTLAKNLNCSSPTDRVTFPGGDISTKLKLMGMEVGSFGDYFPEFIKEPFETLTYSNPLEKVYKKLFFSADGKKLLGGILVGDTSDFVRLSLMYKQKDTKPLVDPPNEILLGKRGGGGGNSVLDLPDEAQVCSCNNVTKGDICETIKEKKLTKLGDVKKICNVGTGCGGCIPMVKDILEAELAAAGAEVDKSLCEHFAYSRQELYQIIQVEQYATFAEVLAKHGRKQHDPRSYGCEICKPTMASIFASLQNGHILKGDRAPLQDSNDRFLANLQKSGQFSVVPRVAGGEITPDKLIVLGQVAKKFDLYAKITGGQRVDLFGAQKQDLPEIWKMLVVAGFESGHAYGKSLRTVKSCVGTTWCRYGQQDSVGFAIFLENRYRGIRSPHKLKGGISGCTRECAEARSKDFGCIATDQGYNVYVGGNGGTNPRHATLLASDVPQDLTVKYLDRYIMYYIMTADRLQRTSKWLDALEGGIEQLRRVIMEDSLGICATLEKQMNYLVGTYECEWKKVIESPELMAQFAQFKNTSENQKEVHMRTVRDQRMPTFVARSKTSRDSESGTEGSSPASSTSVLSAATLDEKEWVPFGSKDLFDVNGGGAVLYGESQLAIFNIAESCNGIDKVSWYATQNMCPFDYSFMLAQGIVGDLDGHPKVACPMHKRNYDLADGSCLSGDDLRVEVFDAKEQDGIIYVLLPPADVVDARLATSKFVAQDGDAPAVPEAAAPVTLDW
ncbi:hypothetical protein BBJ29_008334 [Phytophthora kernoviae]|uniref:Nitrate reductase [NADPH] n=1 Tax=Phytophthora kernoviae TaxID=325452 RepID=A0A3R7HM06_9STRA|nr:hypothetical protein BBJ29_008334 [Phytophthora kernoviae]